MLEQYYVRPDTVDRVRSSWIGKSIERYVEWLTENGYTFRSILRRIPLVMEFGKFAQQHGATKLEELPEQIEKFTLYWFEKHGQGCKTKKTRMKVLANARTPVKQMLDLEIPGLCKQGANA
jgi:integrase/recombinase XerD